MDLHIIKATANQVRDWVRPCSTPIWHGIRAAGLCAIASQTEERARPGWC